jgi:hypothetical protein
MTREQLLEALEWGDYKIKMESDCGCGIWWDIKDGELRPEISTDCCWVGNVLYVTNPETGEDEVIAEQIAFEPFREAGAGMTTEEFRSMLEENELEYIIDDMQFDENNTENEDHNDKLEQTLVEFIEENEFKCYIRYPRNFGNEYNCILVTKDADEEDIPDDAEEIDAEKFADKYLREDNALTKYYIGFELID